MSFTRTRTRQLMEAAWLALLGLSLAPGVGRLDAGDTAKSAAHARLAFSRNAFGEANENDALAAIRAWADSIVKQAGGLPIDSELLNSADLLRAIRNHALDGFVLTTPEYLEVAGLVDPTLMADTTYLRDREQYILLVHAGSDIQNVAGLLGHGINLQQDPRTCLASMWLATLLAAQHLPPPERFFSRVNEIPRLSRTVLPVYFQKADACVVTRRGFQMMCELNPQLGRSMRVIATSPGLITFFFAFSKDCPQPLKESIRAAFLHLHESSAGQQALTLFQCVRLGEGNVSVLRESIALMEAYHRLQTRMPGRSQ
jgi:phosphonate transport system substrate-binding protein